MKKHEYVARYRFASSSSVVRAAFPLGALIIWVVSVRNSSFCRVNACLENFHSLIIFMSTKKFITCSTTLHQQKKLELHGKSGF
jgi:hypothetical protein